MTSSTNSDWLDLCREYRIDPDEVRIVFSRYDAYRQFVAKGRDPGIALDQWFRFYHMEKASEAGGETGPAPSGCSVDSGAVNNACIKRPGLFLTVLEVYLAREESA